MFDDRLNPLSILLSIFVGDVGSSEMPELDLSRFTRMEEDGIIFYDAIIDKVMSLKRHLFLILNHVFMPNIKGQKNHQFFRPNRDVVPFMMQMEKQRVKALW